MSTPRRTRIEPGIYERPDGRFEIGWRDSTGKQRWRVVGGGITAARRALDLAKADRHKDVRVGDPRLTFNAAADEWWSAHVTRLRAATRAVYGVHLADVRKRFGRWKLKDIDKRDVAKYIADLHRAGVAGWTQRGRVTVLSAVFTYAASDLDFPGRNPCSLLSRAQRPAVEDEREHRVLNDDELDGLLRAVSPAHRLLLATAAQTGARKGEVLGLVWGDLDGQTLGIEQQLDRRTLTRVALKTKRSRRRVAISPDLASALRERRMASPRKSAHDLVFVRPTGEPYTHSAADYALAQAVKRAKIKPAPSWHDLRHSHVSRLFAAGQDAVSIAGRIGDSVETCLAIYAHEYDAAKRRTDESAQLARLYDRGSIMEATGSNSPQQTIPATTANVVDLQAIREGAQ